MNDKTLADEIERNGINGRDDFSIADKDVIIAALRRSQPEGEPATEAVREALSNLVSLLLQTMEPIGPMRSRSDYPPELQTAINALKGKGASQGVGGGVTERMVEVAAKWLSESPLIQEPKLPPPAWMGLARHILQAAEASKDTK